MNVVTDGSNEYELERARRIAENQKRLEQLVKTTSAYEALKSEPLAKRQPKSRAPVPKMVFATRSSARVQAVGSKSYKEDAPVPSLPLPSRPRLSTPPSVQQRSSDDEPRAVKRARVMDYALEWSGDEASSRAAQAAQEFAESLPNLAAVKAMTDSQVSGGFWCQVPRELTRGFENQEKRHLKFHWNDDTWEVVFNPRPGLYNAGFSGGWRTFAIDNKVMPDDHCVFEKLSEDAVRCYIFRARDYIGGKRPQQVLTPSCSVPAPSTPCGQHAKVEEAETGSCDGIGSTERSATGAGWSREERVDGQTPKAVRVAKGESKGTQTSTSKQQDAYVHGMHDGDASAKSEPVSSQDMAPTTPPETLTAESQQLDVPPVLTLRATRYDVDSKASPATAAPLPSSSALCEADVEAQHEEAGEKLIGPCTPDAPQLLGDAAHVPQQSPDSSHVQYDSAVRVTGTPADGQGEESAEEPEVFIVEKIRAWKREAGAFKFLIRWEGYGPEYDTWEPMACLDEHPLSYQWAGRPPSGLKRKLGQGL